MEGGLQVRQHFNKTSVSQVSRAMPFFPCVSTTLCWEFQIYCVWVAFIGILVQENINEGRAQLWEDMQGEGRGLWSTSKSLFFLYKRLCHSSWTTFRLTALERALTGEHWWCTPVLTTVVRKINTWRSSYGNKTSLQALFAFRQVTKPNLLNRILALFQCICALQTGWTTVADSCGSFDW